MTKEKVALATRARSITFIALLVAGAMVVTGPAPARAFARGVRGRWLRRRRDAATGHVGATPTASEAATATPAAPASTAEVAAATAAAPAPNPPAEPAASLVADPASVKTPPLAGADPAADVAEGPVAPPAPPAPTTPPSPLHGSRLLAGAPVIGYVTAPAHATNGDLTPSERAIERACARNGWQLVAIVRDQDDGRILDRPGLSHALEQIADGRAEGLVVNDARLLSRANDFAGLVHWFRDAEAALIALDLGFDTSTPAGSRVASTLVTLNGWAGGRRIARRTTPTIAQRPDLLDRIGAMEADELPLQHIADQLNQEGVPGLSGTDTWWPSTVKTALRYYRAKDRAEEEVALRRQAS